MSTNQSDNGDLSNLVSDSLVRQLYVVFHLLVLCMCATAGEGMVGSPLTTSARISALNIVGELLRKVGVSLPFARCD